MKKRAFEHRGDRLRDTCQHGSRTYIWEVLENGESSPAGKSRNTAASEESADAIGRTLSALNAGDVTAPHALVRYADDPRVSPALLSAARKGSPTVLANVAHALGLAKTVEAVAILEERMAGLLTDPRTFARTATFSWNAVALVAVAGALLKLAPERPRAVDALVRMLDHPNPLERNTAAAAVAEALQGILPDELARRLENELQRLASGANTALFGTIAPVIARKEPGLVLRWCEEALGSADADIHETAAAVLMRLQLPRATELLVAHLPKEADLRLACMIAGHLGPSASETLRATLARRALENDSPSLRSKGAELAASLSPKLRRRLAEEALTDEPDPFLRKRLENTVLNVMK